MEEKDLAQLVREKCNCLVKTNDGKDRHKFSFGYDTSLFFEPMVLASSVNFNATYSKFSLAYFFVPEVCKKLMINPNVSIGELALAHYRVKKNKVKKSLNRQAETNRVLREHGAPSDIFGFTNSKKAFGWFDAKYKNPSVITFLRHSEDQALMGEVEDLQKVFNFLKYSPERISDFLAGFNISHAKDLINHFKSIGIYDLVGKPKEVHYKFD